jgi:hypothetical protein
MDVLSMIGGNVLIFILMYHNLYSVNTFMKVMYEAISTASTKEFKEILKAHLVNRAAGREETLKGADYIDSLVAEGIEPTRDKFKFYLKQTPTTKAKTPYGIFSAEPDYEEEDNSRVLHVLDLYDKAQVKHGHRDKTKIKTGHASISSKAKAGPGKKKKAKKKVKVKALPTAKAKLSLGGKNESP